MLIDTESQSKFAKAERELLQWMSRNAWFTESHWPENRNRVELMAEDVAACCSPSAAIFEPGCGNGYISYLFSRMGYKVTATDAWKLPERDDALESIGAKFFYSNLNHLRPFPLVQDGAFDAILFGEVFEHILNHPLGMLRELRRVLKTGGVMVLTTPNPSTITNAVRVALDLHSPWGFRDFLQSVKVSDDGEIIDNGTIHYREYRTREVVEAVTLAGFAVKTVRYLPFGIAASQPLGKRILKRCFQSVSKNRLLGATQYLVCQAV